MRIEEEYAQQASAVSSLRAILEAYPLSIGIFRELIQNSDDAGASKQIFVLDQQNHPQGTLYRPGLAKTQGPALLAFNDAVLRKEDWEALKSMHDSSKSDDESKIGKYGVGFRSVFNITDSPQILSDTSLAIFDPLCLFLDSEGKKVDLQYVGSKCPDQLSPFGFFIRDGSTTSPFVGTVIRCPLRGTPSKLSSEVVKVDTISRLFQEFIDQELGISLLFLQNIKTIEIHNISPTGISTLLAKATITSRLDPNMTGDHSTALTATVKLESSTNQEPQTKEWYIVHSNFPREEAIHLLLQQPGYLARTLVDTLHSAKFSPEIKIAADTTNPIRGRIFTYLPLPIFTGFPVHIHGLFGIDSSRRHLRAEDIGLQSGTRDHTTVEWNKLLFQTFIPRTWRFVLEHLVSHGDQVANVFDFWPPQTSVGELNAYAASLPEHILDTVMKAGLPIWPVYNPQGSSEFRDLDSLVVAPPTEDDRILRALVVMGVSLTRPPKYIFDLLVKSSYAVTTLSPEVAHDVLLMHVDQIIRSSDDDKYRVLDYLLSTRNVSNIRDLPLIPVVDAKMVALSSPSTDVGTTYTMLTRSEFDVFGTCDASAIPLHRLPANVADVLRDCRPTLLNVTSLTVPRIVEYLSQYATRSDLHLSLDPTTVQWFSRFWVWMDTYEHHRELLPKIRNLFVLPSTKGLRKAEAPLFKSRDEHPAYTRAYASIGVPFLSHQLSDVAHAFLRRHDLLKLVSDIPSLLDSLPPTPPSPSQPQLDCPDILKHLANNMPEHFASEIIVKLKQLPIFPILDSSNPVVPQWGPIPPGVSIRSVGKPNLVPVVDGLAFLGLDTIAPGIVKHLEPDHPRPLSDDDLVALAVRHMATQQQRLQLVVLRYISRGRSRIPPLVIDNLCAQAFVLSEDGRSCLPGDVVDPESELAALYSGNYFPARSTPSEQDIVRHLRTLGVLRAALSIEVVKERIEFISTNTSLPDSVRFARHLLSLLGRSNMDFSKIDGIAEQKWLPTNRGLCSASECRYGKLVSSALFDRVLATLENYTIPPSLQTALGWDGPLPLDLIIEQLELVLTPGSNCDDVVKILKEFGRRQWNAVEIAKLERVTRDRLWIPTTNGTLTDIRSAVLEFSPTMLNSGFHQVRMDLKVDELLRKMGCTDRPSVKVIIEKLHALAEGSTSFNPVGVSLGLLKCLPDKITPVERTKLLIPDTTSSLRPFKNVFYNDIGENSRLLRADSDFIAHHSLDETLARKIELGRLGLKYAALRDLGPNMGQAPITTVRENLKRYTEHQFLFEFIANAEDARATAFRVALNLVTLADKPDLRVLSPAMAYLCKLPSLVIHNNAEFTQEDFEGICHTSIGGKTGRSDTIGEFGLGVLTMYHFTDVAIVISGSRVLFMDPSKKHLPVPEYASLTLPLSHVRKFYQDHLQVVDGLFGFDILNDSYEGTLFILPLRENASQPCPEFIVDDFWPPDRVESEILNPFETLALNCLLFTRLEELTCVVRRDESTPADRWSFHAVRRECGVDELNGFTITEIGITDLASSEKTWQVATTSIAKDRLPEALQALPLRRDAFAGLAVQLDRSSPPGPSFNFFSSLPLSTTTSLPMHVMASFLLSSDRRQIRLDSDQKLPSEYNTWLLTQLVPPLYLFFLEHLLSTGDDHFYKRWPREKSRHDVYSQRVIDGLYLCHLASSPRRVFRNGHDSFLTPQEAVISGNEPQSIRQALGLLGSPRVVKLPEGIRILAVKGGIAQVNPTFIKEEILRNPTTITADVDCNLIEDIINYLTKGAELQNLLDELPILPLQDNSFGTLYTQGTGPPYFVWKPKDRNKGHNFPEDHFVHPKMKTNDLLNLRVNVRTLDPMSIRRLLERQLSTYSDLQQLQWIDSFWSSWDEYSSLGLTYNDISLYPLVPTTQPLTFVSLDQCRKGGALLVHGNSPDDRVLQAALHAVGLKMVRTDGEQTPQAIQSILGRKEFPEMRFENVLLALGQTEVPIPELFASIADESRNGFAHWARDNIPHDISELHISFARQLPIWLSAGNGVMPALRPASEVYLLPQGLTHQVAAKFLSVCVADDPSLQYLQPRTLSFQDINARLLLNDTLDEEDLQPYKHFLGMWLDHLPATFNEPIPVPTFDLSIRYSDELYARSRLFEAIFPADSWQFVHPEFAEYEHTLYGRGLRREEDLDVDMFIECVGTLNIDDPDAIPRARELFRAYDERLPARVDTQDRDAWSRLDDLAFVPRRIETERKLEDHGENVTGLEIPPNVAALADIVEPGDLVRREFEPIAWSQRACFEVQPERVFLFYQALGRPSFSEVIEHLRYLSSLKPIRTAQRDILLHDVQRTYQYLNENTPENEHLANEITSILKDEPLFLNIDNSDDRWNWVKGDSLAFDCDDHSGSIQNVRRLLLPFENILTRAGVLQVYHPQVGLRHDDMEGIHESKKLEEVWSGFNRLRQENALTDVAFTIKTNSENSRPEPMFAHRAFLAAFSPYFKDLFCGNYKDSRDPGTGSRLEIKVENSRDCVQAVLDYIYTGKYPIENQTLDLLLEILELSTYWGILDLFKVMQYEIVHRRYITPDTLPTIHGVAERIHADDLLEACEQYEKNNFKFIQKVQSSKSSLRQ